MTGPLRVVIPAPDRPPRPSVDGVDAQLLSALLARAGQEFLEALHRNGIPDAAIGHVRTEVAWWRATGRSTTAGTPPRRPDRYTTAQAAALLGVDERTIRRWVRTDRLSGEQTSPRGRWDIDAGSVRRLLVHRA